MLRTCQFCLPLCAGLLAAAICPELAAAAEPAFSLVAKAQPDEFYTGLGKGYYPLGQQPPGIDGRPKVNQAYVWSLTGTPNGIWFGTAANPVALALGGITGLPIPLENSYGVAEFWKSKYPGVSFPYKIFLGDWRPPEIYRYTPATGAVNVTPDDPLIQSTLGFRAAGTTDDLVILSGPDLSQIGINLFAFDKVTGDYLGSRHISQYSDIRRWVTAGGQSYTGTLKTWTTTGGGSVLRWTGTRGSPFDYEVVGDIDNEAAGLCVHDGRLFALTWSTLSQSIETLTGARSTEPSGVWMSPPIPGGGLTAAHRQGWTKVWSADAYDPDPLVVRSLWMGASASHHGHLIWGTIQIPGYGAQVLKEAYGWPTQRGELVPAIRNSVRSAALFRGWVDPQGAFQAELLYGDPELPVYTRQGNGGTWDSVPNGMGSPLLGRAGFDDPLNLYVWSMLPHQGRLWIGTMDLSFVLSGNSYTAGMPTSSTLGADLLVMDSSDQPAAFVSRTGVGNVSNIGVRDLYADGDTILIGTASASNLLTDPADNLVDGGWELKRFNPAAVAAQRGTARRPSKQPDWSGVLDMLGRLPP